ncbi:bilin biosynthesis protein PecF [Kalymmatonema gypsitolerans NIES-4073]|nr:bilin biosynthesis protein PecF [Scytonema sp. NIES-4073]
MTAIFHSETIEAGAIATLIQALSHHHPSVRNTATEALVKLAPATVEPLIAAFRTSSDQGLQAHIIHALAQIAVPTTLDLLSEVVGTAVANHCQGNVRRIAARGLGRIGSTTDNPEIMRHAVEKLSWALLTPEDWGLRYAAAVSLQEIATPEACAFLQVAQNQESDKVVRSRITVALEQLTS